MPSFQCTCALALLLCLAVSRSGMAADAPDDPAVRGLSHVPVAVTDLDAASSLYVRLGFVLKPGRPHADGIANRHAKFADGTEIELITARQPVDALSAGYVDFLHHGDGPAFVALYAPDLQRLDGLLGHIGQAHIDKGGLVALPDGDRLSYLFFAGLNGSPTDRPEYFRHPNGADGLIAVWLVGEDLSAEHRLLGRLGARFRQMSLGAPCAAVAEAAQLASGAVLLLHAPPLQPGRHIMGVSLRVHDLAPLRAVLASSGLPIPPIIGTGRRRSMFLPPQEAGGMWMEFRESP